MKKIILITVSIVLIHRITKVLLNKKDLHEGKVYFTGTLGDVMKESVQTSYSYLKANSQYFNIDIDEINKYDVHIQFTNPEFNFRTNCT